MFVHAVHVSDILLKTMDLNETYSIETHLPNQEDDEFNTNNNVNPLQNKKKNNKPPTNCSCKRMFLFGAFCLLTVLIIGGFVVLFGPLIDENKNTFQFNASQIIIYHYRLRLEPNVTENSFKGRASIVFNNLKRTKELHLISQDLTIGQVNITVRNHINVKTLKNFTNGGVFHVGKSTVGIQSIFVDQQLMKKLSCYAPLDDLDERTKNKKLFLILDNPLEIGDYMLDIHYSGFLNSSRGLERTDYLVVDDGRIRNKSMLVLNEASKVFPYFGNKQNVHFELSVARKTDVSCFSNVPIKETELMNKKIGYVWDHFKTTPAILPTSLALIISDYKSVNITNNLAVVLQIYALKRHTNNLNYAASIFPTIFDYFQKYFQMRYPLTKLDLVLVDNAPISSKLGLITVDGEHLIMDIIDDNLENRRKIFAAIGEGVALQWLNNNVMKRGDKFLKGFGKFLAYNVEKNLNEEDEDIHGEKWSSEQNFVGSVSQKSLEYYEVLHVNEQEEDYKIACILRMINYTVGEQVFQLGINKFLSNSNEDFWESADTLRLLGNLTGKQLLLSWLDNPSYPVITVSRTTGWNFLIEQQSILPNHEDDTFVVPITYISQKDSRNVQHFTLNTRKIEKNLFVPQDQWILFNYKRIGYYRVNYEVETWQQLINQLETQPATIPVINRAQLISDAFALADVDLLQYEVPFKLIRYLSFANDSDYMPWKSAIEALNRHETVFLDSSDYGIFRKFKLELLSKLWNSRNNIDDNLSELVENELCKMQFKPCIEAALEVYDKFKHRKDVDTPQWVYCTAIAHKQEEDFEFLFHKLAESRDRCDPRKSRVLLQSLTCTKIAWKLTRYLEYSLKHKNTAKYIWRSMASNSLGRLAAITFIETHWKSWNNLIDHDEDLSKTVKIIIDEFLSTLTTSTDLNKIQTLYLTSASSLQDNFHNAITSVLRRVEWSKRHYNTFISYLLKN